MTKYKIGDTVRLKPLEKLFMQKEQEALILNMVFGFYLKNSHLFINKGMYKYLGEKYKITKIIKNWDSINSKGDIFYELDLEKENSWLWNKECFEESPQLEFEF